MLLDAVFSKPCCPLTYEGIRDSSNICDRILRHFEVLIFFQSKCRKTHTVVAVFKLSVTDHRYLKDSLASHHGGLENAASLIALCTSASQILAAFRLEANQRFSIF